eukprot:CAMPEP_0206153096 /NCGR_PEP_ID=MMETSP1474-20131121/368_1 /ASSEMBLY_ACC=CAM_ASM_001110 /TAXON_ID=97495 /ORGANISM="Imantonia sp., Strain RCC918" /LENGTH=136 /DNA_ID=CAMNT_0053550789 /DNA_START=293 /DNA_END=704 /DNA_ORIENTATION=+
MADNDVASTTDVGGRGRYHLRMKKECLKQLGAGGRPAHDAPGAAIDHSAAGLMALHSLSVLPAHDASTQSLRPHDHEHERQRGRARGWRGHEWGGVAKLPMPSSTRPTPRFGGRARAHGAHARFVLRQSDHALTEH